MEVDVHDLGSPSHSLDGRGVDLEELIKVDGLIVLIWDVWIELGWQVNLPQPRDKSPTPSYVETNVVVAGGAALLLFS